MRFLFVKNGATVVNHFIIIKLCLYLGNKYKEKEDSLIRHRAYLHAAPNQIQ